MADMYIASGKVSAGIVLGSGDRLYVQNGGKATETTVSSGGSLFIQPGGSAVETAISQGGSMFVSSGGAVASTAVYSGGGQFVDVGGSAHGVDVYSGGRLHVHSGGSAVDINQELGGNVGAGIGSATLMSGVNASGAFTLAGGVASGFILYSEADMYLFDGTTSGTLVSGGYMVCDGGCSASVTTLSSGGYQRVFGRGVLSGTVVSYGGSMSVEALGTASVTTVCPGAEMTVWHGGTASGMTLSSGGRLLVNSGGTATGIRHKPGGMLSVFVASDTLVNGGNESGAFSLAGGVASGFILYFGAFQQVSSGCIAQGTTVHSGADLHVASGGSALGVNWLAGGNVFADVAPDGTRLTGTNESGAFSLDGGVARGFILYRGGHQYVYSGGRAYGTTIHSGCLQEVYDSAMASGTTVSSGGRQNVYAEGRASDTTICSGGVVNAEGKVATATVQKGGKLNVKANGKATGIALQAGGTLAIAKGGTASTKSIASGARIALKAGGTLNLAAGNTLYGAVSFSGATLTGGSTTKRVKLATGAKLSMGAKTNMSKLHLNAGSASLAVAGTGSTLGSVSLNAATQVSYNVSKLVASSTTYMLSLKTASKQCKGKFSITVAKSQGVGVYELSKGIWQKNGASYSIMLGTKNLGVAKVNGLGRVNGNVVYSLASDASHRINLTVAKGAGTAKRGTAGANKLTGGSTWDVFYGGKGNDTISGVNGHDVAVYDKTAWGKDVIASTKGRMTLLFKDLKAGDIVKKLNGSTMTITRNGDSAQSITVKGWSSAKHKIVFGSGMTAFNTFLKAGTVTTAVGKGARNEAWKKAGLAQA